MRSLDPSRLINDKDASQYSDYPEYLYNDKLMDDVNYWLNKMTILEGCMIDVIGYSIGAGAGGSFPDDFSFDEYSTWYQLNSFDRESVLAGYNRPEKGAAKFKLTDEEKEMILENVTQNVTELVSKYPDTTFLLFFPPYSICYWDALVSGGSMEREIEAQRVAIEEILKYNNIELYSFCNNFEVVCDLNNYKDIAHYSEKVNSWMLGWMHEGEYRLTWDNYERYLEEIYEFYEEYDYDVLFE